MRIKVLRMAGALWKALGSLKARKTIAQHVTARLTDIDASVREAAATAAGQLAVQGLASVDDAMLDALAERVWDTSLPVRKAAATAAMSVFKVHRRRVTLHTLFAVGGGALVMYCPTAHTLFCPTHRKHHSMPAPMRRPRGASVPQGCSRVSCRGP